MLEYLKDDTRCPIDWKTRPFELDFVQLMLEKWSRTIAEHVADWHVNLMMDSSLIGDFVEEPETESGSWEL